MKTVSIIFTEKNKAELVSRELPELKDNEILVENMVTTISSGTERANITGNPTVGIYDYSEVAVFPRSSGYSDAGIVRAVGKDVRKFKEGDRVSISWGKHTKYIAATEDMLYHLDDSISFSEAALFHIATFPMAAIRKCHLEMGESALVMGLGVLGLCAVQLLRAAGAVPIVVADPLEEKREKALKLGADYALDPTIPDFAERVKQLTGGIRVAIEVTGIGAGLNMALDCMAKFGRVALLGCTRSSDFTVDYYHKVHGPGITLVGAHTMARPDMESSFGLWTTRDDVEAIQRLSVNGRLSLQNIVDETHPYTEAPEIYQRLCTENGFPVVQFDWRECR